MTATEMPAYGLGNMHANMHANMRGKVLAGISRASRSACRVGVLALVTAAAGCDAPANLLVVYTSMDAATVEAIEDGFEATFPDTDVRMVALSPEEALDRLRQEKGASQADVWWGPPVNVLATAAAEDLLQPSALAWGQELAEAGRDAQDRWHSVAVTPYVFAFSTEHIARSRMPRDWQDLFHNRWAGEVLLPDPGRHEATAALMGALMLREEHRTGVESAGFDWLRRLDGATAGYSESVDDLLFDLRAGQGTMAILPLAEVVRAMRTDRDWLQYTVPESGAPLDSRGVAVLRGTESAEKAQAFLLFLGSVEARTAVLQQGFWFLGRKGLSTSSLPGEYPEELAAASRLRPWATNYQEMARRLPGWLEHWRAEIRGTATPLP